MMKILVTLLVAITMACASPARAETKAAPVAKKEASAASGGVWAVRCNDPKTGQKHCEMFQRLSITKKGEKDAKRLVEFAIGYKDDSKKKDAQGILVLPLGVLVSEPVEIEIDEKKNFEAEIRYCDGKGCYAFTEIPAGMLEKMAKGNKFTVKARAANGQNFHIVMSLLGFNAALDKMKS